MIIVIQLSVTYYGELVTIVTGVHDMYTTVCNGDCCTLLFKLVHTVCCCAMTMQFSTPIIVVQFTDCRHFIPVITSYAMGYSLCVHTHPTPRTHAIML